MRKTSIIALLLIVGILTPSVSFGAQFSYGAWIPYWKKTAAIPETIQHIDTLKEISPFAYEVNTNGTIHDAMKLKDVSWLTLMETAGSKGIKVVPSFSWQDGNAIHRVLSSSAARAGHMKNVLQLVDENDFDGIDIDYEGKKAETNTYFSKFLTELSKAMHARKKTLSCTIEARTPVGSRFVTIPKKLEYANDFGVINKVCDEVRIMAYEQGRIDLKLNKKKSVSGAYYFPVSDTEWVDKVIVEAVKTISKNKLMLAIGNFGYEYDVINNNGVVSYNDVQSLTFNEAKALASSTGAAFVRNNAGELGFTYTTSTNVGTSTLISTRFVTLSDAKAIRAKIALAKKYKLKGIFLFKIDGESDPALWDAFGR